MSSETELQQASMRPGRNRPGIHDIKQHIDLTAFFQMRALRELFAPLQLSKIYGSLVDLGSKQFWEHGRHAAKEYALFVRFPRMSFRGFRCSALHPPQVQDQE